MVLSQGLEPRLPAPKADVLPLDDKRLWSQVKVTLLTSRPYERQPSTCSLAWYSDKDSNLNHRLRTPLCSSITPSEHGSRGGIRTHTEAILSRSPLPNWDTRPLVGEVGLEPTHPYGYDILSVARLPIPPHPRY